MPVTGPSFALVLAVSAMLNPGSPTLGSILARSAGISAQPTSIDFTDVSPSIATWGQAVKLSARVSAKGNLDVSGLIDFSDGNRVLGTCHLLAASCVFTVHNLHPGKFNVSATYRDPQASFAPSHASAQVQVSPRSTATTLTPSDTSIDYGSPLKLSIVTAPPSTGRVAINDGPFTLANLFTDGSAIFSTTALAIGTHIITAAFLGDEYNLGSQASVTVSVNRDSSQTSLCVRTGSNCVASLRVSSPQSFNLQGQVTASNPQLTGNLFFYDRGSQIGEAQVGVNGTAQETVDLGLGDHFLSAKYSGNDAILDSDSGVIPLAVGPSPTSLSINQSASIADNQSAIALTVYVSSEIGAPSGDVSLTDNGSPMGALNLSGGVASLSVHFGWGRHVISAVYAGDADHQGSANSTVHFTSISVVYYQQTHELSCEATALQIALSASGNNRFSQDALLDMIGFDTRPPTNDAAGFHWGDPYVAFVGNVDGYEGDHWRSPFGAAGDPGTGYGVYYPPIASTAQAAGATVLYSGEGISPGALYGYVNDGHPAEVWLTVGFGAAPYNEYMAFDGRRVPYTAPKDHVLVLVGVTDSSVVLANPVGGYRQMISRGSFEYSFSFLHNMAVVLA